MAILDRLASVRYRLIGAFGSGVVVVVGIGAFGAYGIQEANTDLERVYEQNLLSTQMVGNIKSSLSEIRGQALSTTTLRDDQATTRILKDIGASQEALGTSLAAYYPAMVSSEEERQTAIRFINAYDQMDAGMARMLQAIKGGDYDRARDAYVDQVRDAFVATRGISDELLGIQKTQSKAFYEAAASRAETEQWLIWIAMILAGISTAAVGYWTLRSIIPPLSRAQELTGSIAEGRLDNEIDTQRTDEFGDMLRGLHAMQQRLASVVTRVHDNSESVSSAAREIASGNDDLSRRTQEQAASLEQTAASMEQMTSTVRQNAENAIQANELASGVSAQAQEGGEVVERAVQAMSEINASSKKIADIVGMIDEIAFQTNLLALNAAVEAARAGEQGRGFAVVASEVRNLAQRSAKAAKEITGLVEESVHKVESGSQLVTLSGQTLTEIVESVKKVSNIVAEISNASQEQSTGIDQVNQAVSQMDQGTQQNAALVEEAAASSRTLEEQADQLRREVGFFQLGALGANQRLDARLAPPVPSMSARKADHASSPRKTSPTKAKASPVSAKPSRPKQAPAMTTAAGDDDWETF
ncbi:methyl-accepting chemotaxis protein [Larsenimonas suaedae]|uniref:Methyl-accepting chemotaxis protein n=1 Tax=Larsenimonas suaedae TaxID=1851019 RepID=A0ABU1GWS5_9GAMM|nr:methyl-accepting chemotaxis protein [Larsenimonas suaedae]MDR5896001.1 methyl-accepting chemotaxis protein [Larsenimonas suaedae]